MNDTAEPTQQSPRHLRPPTSHGLRNPRHPHPVHHPVHHPANTPATPHSEQAIWQAPDYTVIETALEVTAYSLNVR
ncbi:pyrroloquinoline quinone precursor peptide PqqA [Streptomyces piniterrae]|uniref:Coenzyme PQQ synthesis protein A n=1 Tax=Streptomyces piniterrae TaxID=2571125 RepID=A0A4U0P8X1_9ACTN|nr:pyrroloquinoline quinone precursor peptide PqqA [Streptomyces piniterrae]TJZ59174.1 pyrroloquinoline quinone precursor peptide PqqA [Streptomyces piniterrae]